MVMNVRVLFADDSATMRKIIARLLDEAGVDSPTAAADGDEAVKLFQSDKFDLVLTDWNMPNKNGLEVVREIRALNPNIPIIMITTEAEKGRIAQAISAGATDYIVKPFDRDKLREKLEAHLNKNTAEGTPQWYPQFVSRPTTSPAAAWQGFGKS